MLQLLLLWNGRLVGRSFRFLSLFIYFRLLHATLVAGHPWAYMCAVCSTSMVFGSRPLVDGKRHDSWRDDSSETKWLRTNHSTAFDCFRLHFSLKCVALCHSYSRAHTTCGRPFTQCNGDLHVPAESTSKLNSKLNSKLSSSTNWTFLRGNHKFLHLAYTEIVSKPKKYIIGSAKDFICWNLFGSCHVMSESMHVNVVKSER